VNIAAEIFAEHWDYIRTIIRYKASDKDQVDDLFQDLFLSLVSRPPSSNIKNIKAYLYRAIINDIIDNARRIKRYQNKMCGYAERLKYFKTDDRPEDALVKTEEMNEMFECIEKRLRHSEARAVTLRYKKNYKIKEVAAAMDVNKIAAWRYVSKGLREIRQFLEKKHLLWLLAI